MIMDLRGSKLTERSAFFINGEKMRSFKFPGFHILADLPWSTHVSHHVGKAQHRLLFLRKLSQAYLP